MRKPKEDQGEKETPVRIVAYVPWKHKRALDLIALSMSRPGGRVSLSACVNQAILDYIDKHSGRLT